MLSPLKRIILVLIGALIFTYSVAGAQSLATVIIGQVLDDQSGNPITGAVVSIDAIASTQTDSSGNFSLAVPAAEPYRLVSISVTAPGHGSWLLRDTPLYPDISRTLRILMSNQDQIIQDALPRAITQELPLPPGSSPVPLSPNYFSNSVLPSTIRVAITNGAPSYTSWPSCAGWVNANKPVVRVDLLDLQEYAKNVLPHEWIASWGNDAPDSLRAGALAVKMFAWRLINLGWRSQQGADVVDNTCDQVYVSNSRNSLTDAAVDQTWKFIMRRNGAVIEIHYLATVAQCQASSLQPCMPQWGTYDDAKAGMSWMPIVHKYYDPVQIAGFWFYFPLMKK